MAKLDASRLETGGAPAPVAVGNQFKPYLGTPAAKAPSASASASPSSSPTSFVGPIPVAATRTDTGYTTSSGTTVTPASKTSAPASTPAPAAAPATSYSGSSVTNQAPNTVSKTFGVQTPAPTSAVSSSNQFKLKPYVNPTLSPDATVMSWDSTVSDEEKKRSAASGKAALQAAWEFTGVPAAYRLSSGSSPKILEKELGSGWESKAAGTALDVAMALPVVGKVAKAVGMTGALGKTAKTIGVADAALKGGKMLKDVAGTKGAAVAAATAMTLAPTAGKIVDFQKAGTAISQSATAGKAAKTIDTFVPSAAKASSKGTSSVAKSVESIPKKAPATSGFSAGTKANTAKATAAGYVGSSVVTASKAGDSINNQVKDKDVVKKTVDNQDQVKVNDSRATQFKFEVDKPGSTDEAPISKGKGKTTFKGVDSHEFKDPTPKNTETKIKFKGIASDEAAYVAKDPFPFKKPFETHREFPVERPANPEVPRPPKKPEPPKKPRRIPLIKVKGDGRQWNPSSIV